VWGPREKRAEYRYFGFPLQEFAVQGSQKRPKRARFTPFQRDRGFAADCLAGEESFEPSIEVLEVK